MLDIKAGTRLAAAKIEAAATGLRLCDIVDEPPRPTPLGSNTSAISVCIMSDQSRAILPKLPVSVANTCAISIIQSRLPCHVQTGTLSYNSFAQDRKSVV